MAQPIRVFHVDDEPDFAAMAAAFLERESDRLNVTTATGSTDALERLAEHDIDCIISDYDMPGRNGIEFLRDVREDHPEIPFILFTGKGSEEVASEAISAGVTDYFQKQPGQEQYQLLANRVLDATAHQRSKTSYEEIFEKSPDGIVIHDADDGSFVEMNTKYVELFGYDSPDEFLAAGFEAIHPDEPPYTMARASQHVQRAIEDGPQTIEWPGIRKDGSQFWAEVHLTPVELHGKERVLAAVRDIDERREYQAELELERSRTAYALEATNSYIFEIDFETGDEQRFGDWDSIHGIGSEAAPTTEQFIERAVHPADRSVVKDAHREFEPEPGATVRFDYRTNPDQGAVRWVRAKLKVRSGPGDDTLRGIGLATDVTELKRRQEELERQNERLDEFTSVVSHDLRNPLNVAEGRLELARDDWESQHLDEAMNAIERCQTLIDDLLTLARDGTTSVQRQPVTLSTLVEESWQNVETGEATLVAGTDLACRADRSRLKQLLENLIRNAVEHGGTDVTVTVGDLENGFYVEDDGPGIPRSEREQVFDAGYTTRDGSTGFGLAIVKRIVAAHEWSIAIEESESDGARFEITGVSGEP